MFKKEIHIRINELHQNDKAVLFYPEIKTVTKFSKGRWQLLRTDHIADVFRNISKYYKYDSNLLNENQHLDKLDLDHLIKWSLYGSSTYLSAMKVIDTYIMCKIKEPEITMVESVHKVFEYNQESKCYVEKDTEGKDTD